MRRHRLFWDSVTRRYFRLGSLTTKCIDFIRHSPSRYFLSDAAPGFVAF
ncbi:hypothetical protein RRSWK_04547 [Rhodopirellula sp. SWK7]|nr:hypothetical protein RRSWK_04547 [Rhodopirellula sp. SWK7]